MNCWANRYDVIRRVPWIWVNVWGLVGESLARAINIVQNCMVAAAGGEKDVHAWVWDDMVNPYHTGGRDYEQASCKCSCFCPSSQTAKAYLAVQMVANLGTQARR